jgi:cell division initiation protein
MDLSPQLLQDVAFHEAKKGYNTQEVDEFLERLAVAIERQAATLREAKARVEEAEARVADAERRAAAAARASESSEADDTLKRTLVLAQRTADAAIKEAEEQAAHTLSSAQDQAARLLADAQEATARARSEGEAEVRRAQEEARARVLVELQELEGSRDQLQGDVDALDRHLQAQRDRLRGSVDELQRLLDDPSALAEVPPPTLSGASVPDFAPPSLVHEPPVRTAPLVATDPPDAWEPEASPEEAEVEQPQPSTADDSADDDPPTEPVDVLAERDADDDAYLAELRKAMTDESPLGPREDAAETSDMFDGGGDASRTRFGRRR